MQQNVIFNITQFLAAIQGDYLTADI